MKNILFLEQFSNISGGQKMLLSMVSGLDKSKFTSMVAIPGKGELSDELDRIGIKYFIIPVGSYSAGKKNIFDAISLIFRSAMLVPITYRLIKNNGIDIVYCNAPRTFLWGTIAAKLAGKPVVWHLHSIFSGLELRLCKFSLQLGVNRVIAISKAVINPFVDGSSYNEERFHVIYNGIDTQKFSNIPEDWSVRTEFGINGNGNIVGYIGQLAKWKGVEDLVRAANEVLMKRPDTYFLVIGDVLFGGAKEIAFKESLHEMVRGWGIAERVKFTGQRSDIPRLLSAMDILVVPSKDPEPLSLALLEAMASGKAVVASDQGGPAEIISDGKNGRLFKPGDFHSLSDVILELLNDPSGLKSIAQQAQKDALSKYSIEGYIANIESALTLL